MEVSLNVILHSAVDEGVWPASNAMKEKPSALIRQSFHGSPNRSGRCEERIFFSMLDIEQKNLGAPARNLDITSTDLSWLPYSNMSAIHDTILSFVSNTWELDSDYCNFNYEKEVCRLVSGLLCIITTNMEHINYICSII